MQDNLALFDHFVSATHFIAKTILGSLSDTLGLRGSDRFEDAHRDDVHSKSTLYFLHYPQGLQKDEKVGQNMHTDVGSLTLLFAWDQGLQVLSPTSNNWEYIEPRAGHAIVNVGDTFRFLSNKRLRSSLHRVLPVDNLQFRDRYSVAYFLRAADNVEFRDSNGIEANMDSWYVKKFDMYKKPHEEQRRQNVLTGGMEDELMEKYMKGTPNVVS